MYKGNNNFPEFTPFSGKFQLLGQYRSLFGQSVTFTGAIPI